MGVAYRAPWRACRGPAGSAAQGGPIGVGRITVNLKAPSALSHRPGWYRCRCHQQAVGSGLGVGARFDQQLVDDLAIRGIGRGDGHIGDQLVVGIDIQVSLVPIEGPRPRLVPVAGCDIDGGDQPIRATLPAMRNTPSSPASTSWPATNASSSAAGAEARRADDPQGRAARLGVADQRIHQRLTGFRVVPVTRRFTQGRVVVVTGQRRAHRGRQLRVNPVGGRQYFADRRP